MAIEVFTRSNEAPKHWPERKWDNQLRVKDGSRVPQGIHMTTIYDEMPHMTEKEITEWKRDNMETRAREMLKQIRFVKSTCIDLSNLTTNSYVTQLNTLVYQIDDLVQKVIDELPAKK